MSGGVPGPRSEGVPGPMSGGVPHPRSKGVPHPMSGEVPHLRSGWGGGTPSHVQGVLHLRSRGVPGGVPHHLDQAGVPPTSDLRWGTPPDLAGVPPPHLRPEMGYPPRKCEQTENITFPILRIQAVMRSLFHLDYSIYGLLSHYFTLKKT